MTESSLPQAWLLGFARRIASLAGGAPRRGCRTARTFTARQPMRSHDGRKRPVLPEWPLAQSSVPADARRSLLLHHSSTTPVDSSGLARPPVDSDSSANSCSCSSCDHNLRAINKLPNHRREGSIPSSSTIAQSVRSAQEEQSGTPAAVTEPPSAHQRLPGWLRQCAAAAPARQSRTNRGRSRYRRRLRSAPRLDQGLRCLTGTI